ncbi:MAG: pre-toxin TG domain-containing protein, partial [Rhabdochlamydiaceae bacterium]
MLDFEEIIKDPTFTNVIKVVDPQTPIRLSPLDPAATEINASNPQLDKEGLEAAKEVLDTALDFVPYVGSIKAFQELVTGKDLITGEHVPRWVSTGGIILGLIPAGKVIFKAVLAMKKAEKT